MIPEDVTVRECAADTGFMLTRIPAHLIPSQVLRRAEQLSGKKRPAPSPPPAAKGKLQTGYGAELKSSTCLQCLCM